MSDLDEMKGLDVGDTYRNDKSCREFISAIADVERENIEMKLKEASFISVLSDGSTDVSVIENEIVYVHFCVRGQIQTYFVKLCPVERANADGILNAIKSSLQESFPTTDSLKKIVAFGADGAAVNTGQVSGVISKMQAEVRGSIVMVQCMVHRLELAYKDAFNQCKTVQSSTSSTHWVVCLLPQEPSTETGI